MTRSFTRLALGAALVTAAAPRLLAQNTHWCATDRMHQEALARDPHLRQREAQYEAWIQNWIQEHRGEREEDTIVYTIPVVFHIIHMNGRENISNEQIFDEMEVLNRDYRKLNSDVNTVCCGFQDIAADIRLEFKLATIDPEGNCTNGIERIRSVETFIGDNGSKLHIWPRDKYLNVWTVSKMKEGTAGYSQYPSAVEGLSAPADGVIILHDYIGRIGTGSDFSSRALTHEVGHWLNLQHVWGDNNGEGNAPPGHMSPDCGDDAVEDTPWTRGWSICPSPAQSKNCNDTIYENFENYMEYSYCSKMFTEGQKERMRAALISFTAERNNLWTSENLAATGINGISDRQCAPQADFYAYDDAVVGGSQNDSTPNFTRFYCVNDQVHLFDNSTHGTVDWWSWNLGEGASPATSTERNPVVTYSTPGWKSITLTVGNNQGQSTVTHPYDIVVTGGPEIQGVLQQNFESAGSDNGFWPENYENNWTYWHRVTTAGHSGNASYEMNGRDTWGPNDLFIDDGANDIDALVTPSMDLTYLQNGELTFWYAYTTRTTDLTAATERLQIWSSSNCGRTWNLKNTIRGTELISSGGYEADYVPQSESEWRMYTVPITGSMTSSNVRFKFIYYSSAASNNLYIDDINISGNVGINTPISNTMALTLAPNPTDAGVSIAYTLPSAGVGTVSIEDLQGRTIWSRATRQMNQERFTIDPKGLGMSAGVYLVRLQHTSGQQTQRLVVR